VTPDEVFRQLRDIHLPDVARTTQTDIDPRPLIIFAVLVLALAGLRLWARRRRAAARLRQINPSLPVATQRDQIVRILRDEASGRAIQTVPASAFRRPSEVTASDVDDLRTWARRRLR
jgi:hypothetical protein